MRVLLLVHRNLVPPPPPRSRTQVQSAPWRTEYDVYEALLRLGHQVELVGVLSDLNVLHERLLSFKPDVVFNLLEEFAHEAVFDSHVVAYLELMGVPYTGCGPRGLTLARDKTLAKSLAAAAGIRVPRSIEVGRAGSLRRVRQLKFPLIVKYRDEDGSLGLTRESVVHSEAQLLRQVARMLERPRTQVMVEEFIEGREIYVGLLMGRDVKTLPPRELHFGRLPTRHPRLASHRMKWDARFRRRWGVHTRAVPHLEARLRQSLEHDARLVASVLSLTGYARLDFRLNALGQWFFIEANPNPQLCRGEDFADAAERSGLDYLELIDLLLTMSAKATRRVPLPSPRPELDL